MSSRFDITFPFSLRMAEQVANAVSTEVQNNTQYGRVGDRREQENHPTILSIKGAKESPTFRYEGGIAVRVYLIGGRDEEEREPENWWVTRAEVRYYKHDPESYSVIGNQKVVEVWDANKLLELKEKRDWWHPHVVCITEEDTYQLLY